MTQFKILIVDDEPELLEMTARLFIDRGHEVVTACNGRQAHDLYLDARQNQAFDVVLTDMSMPEGVTGVLLAQMIHGAEDDLSMDERTPVIVYTGRMQGDFGGVAVVLAKPFCNTHIIAIVEGLAAAKKNQS